MSYKAPGMASTHMDAELYSFGCMDTQLDTHDTHRDLQVRKAADLNTCGWVLACT